MYAGVLGEVLDVLRVRATSEHDREAGVPEIVPSYVRQLRTLEQGLEEPVDYVLCLEGSTLARGKYES